MLSSTISLFLLALFFKCFLLRANAYADIRDQIFVKMNGTEGQCIRMLNGTDSVGCQSNHNGNAGALVEIAQKKDVQNEVDNLPFGIPDIIAVVQLKNFNGALIDVLRSHANVVGILLIYHTNEKPRQFSEDASCPNHQFSFYFEEKSARTCHGWNQKGSVHPSGLKFVDFNKPLRLITNNDETKLIVEKCIEPFNKKLVSNGLRCMGRMTQLMSAAGNAKICLERMNDLREPLCEVLEDENVFLMLNPLSQLNKSADQFVLATRMDSFSTFRNAKGADLSALSSIISVLLVAHSIGQKIETFNGLAEGRQLLFAFLHGESLGYIGSSRWMWDMGRALFPAAAKNFSKKEDNVQQIGVDKLSFFMEIQQIGESSSLYAHTDKQTYNNNQTLIDMVIRTASKSGDLHFVANSSIGVPPSSYHSILKITDKVPGLVLSSFGPSEYKYRYLNSFLDYQTHTKEFEDFLQKIINASKIALSAALYYVFNNSTAGAAFEIDSDFAKNLTTCFLKENNWSCPLFRDLLNATNDRHADEYLADTANLFSIGSENGRLKRPVIVHLVFLLLAHFTGSKKTAENVRTRSQCRDLNSGQNVYNYIWMNDGSTGNASCYRTSIYLTNAKSPAFEIEDYDFTSGQYSTWVVSNWVHEAKFELYLKADYRLELYAFITAFVVLMLCVPLLYTPKEQWFLDNFLPPGSPQPL